MPSSQLYGFLSHDIRFIADTLSNALAITLQPHESFYRAGVYYHARISDRKEEFILQKNMDLVDNEPAEPEFSEFPIILYVDTYDMPDKFVQIIFSAMNNQVKLLRQKSINVK